MELNQPGWSNLLAEHSAASGVHSLDDQVVQHHLLLGSLHNGLLHTLLGHKAIDAHL